MLTNTSNKYKLKVNDKEGVIQLLKDALDNPNFSGFSAHKSQDWPSGTFENNPEHVFNVSIDIYYATHK